MSIAVSVRSYLVAGTAAAIGAGSLALHPAAPAPVRFDAALAHPQVQLTSAIDDLLTPVTALFASGGLIAYYLFDTAEDVPNFGDISNPPWLPGFGPAFPYTKQGILGQVLTDGFPVVEQLVTNLVDGISYATNGVVNGVDLSFQGEFGPALESVVDGLVQPLLTAINRAGAAIAALVDGIGLITRSAIGVLQLAGKALEYTFEVTGAALADGDLLGAFAALSTGLLGNRFPNPDPDAEDPEDGPYALPGVLIRGTIGTVVFDPAEPLAPYDTIVPSIRTAVSQTLVNVKNALAQPLPNQAVDEGAALAASATAAVTPLGEPVETAEADVDAPKVEAPAAGESVRPVRRAAAKAAPAAEAAPAAKAAPAAERSEARSEATTQRAARTAR